MLNAWEMWLFRRMARITWEMKRNESVLREIGVVRELLRTLKNRKKKWLGHIMRGNSFMPDSNRRETRRKKGKGKKKKSYTTEQSGGRKIVRRTEKDGRRQRRMEAVKPV